MKLLGYTSYIGKFYEYFMYAVVVLSFGIIIAASVPALSRQPSRCQHPACSNSSLCPGYEICTPTSFQAFDITELVIEIFFLVEYAMRILTVWAVSTT